tara:strand:- start:688 stop:1542 length:855 start_codon:yes stop_codon:yes gene_type:complete
MRVLVLGASGLIGNAIFKILSISKDISVSGTFLNSDKKKFKFNDQMILINLMDHKKTKTLINKLYPDIVINCCGITKHHKLFSDSEKTIYLNSILPHKLRKICIKNKIRLIQISTDCVFKGNKGNYHETDDCDAYDFYGKSKSLGEICSDSMLTIRTSTIGHEIETKYGLLEWFLLQKNECLGFEKAFFSGLTSLEFAKIIKDFILPNEKLNGIIHIGGQIISKYDLLKIINKVYNKNIIIERENKFILNRSLNSEKFYKFSGYKPKSWDTLINELYQTYNTRT